MTDLKRCIELQSEKKAVSQNEVVNERYKSMSDKELLMYKVHKRCVSDCVIDN